MKTEIDIDTSEITKPNRGMTITMISLAVLTFVLYLLSIFVLHNENGATSEAIMFSAFTAIASSQILYNLLKRKHTEAVSVSGALVNFFIVTGVLTFLLLNFV